MTRLYFVSTTEEELLVEKALAIRAAVGDLELCGVPAEALIGVYTWMVEHLPAEVTP